MRRSFAIVLALVLSLGLVLPAFAQSAASVLPACCRRTGAHHCSMGTQEVPAAGATIIRDGTKCPLFPPAVTAAHNSQMALKSSAKSMHEQERSAADINLHNCAFSNRPLLRQAGRGPPCNLRA